MYADINVINIWVKRKKKYSKILRVALLYGRIMGDYVFLY